MTLKNVIKTSACPSATITHLMSDNVLYRIDINFAFTYNYLHTRTFSLLKNCSIKKLTLLAPHILQFQFTFLKTIFIGTSILLNSFNCSKWAINFKYSAE